MIKPLGTLERVNLQDGWAHEALEFTPWLASEAGMKLLGETLGMDLVREAEEHAVGPFRADILARRTDTAEEQWVVIENQLAKTDHSHLGQVLTYAAGLKASTVIWVAATFTDEHRAAFDWLNEATGSGFEFYGLEVELWRINGSLPAPKFNMVCRPNDWQRATKEQAEANVSTLKQTYRAYWAAMFALLAQSPTHPVKQRKPQPQNWMYFSLGRTGAWMSATISATADELCVSCDLGEPFNNVFAFQQLWPQKDAIEAEIGAKLDWREQPEKKTSRILLYKKSTNPEDVEDWPAQHAWFVQTLDLFDKAFRPRVAKLAEPVAATSMQGVGPEGGGPPQ